MHLGVVENESRKGCKSGRHNFFLILVERWGVGTGSEEGFPCLVDLRGSLREVVLDGLFALNSHKVLE